MGVGAVGKEVIVLEKLALAGRAREVEPPARDVGPCVQHGDEELAIPRHPGQLAQAHQVREHLVGFAVGRLVDLPRCEQGINDPRAARFVPRLHDIPGEVQVSLVAREAVEQDHRLQHAGGCHPHVRPGRQNTFPVRAEGAHEQIPRLAARLQRSLVAGVLVVGEQPDETVLVRPDIPVRLVVYTKAELRHIRAEIAVCLLGLDEFAGGVVELLAQLRVAGIDPRQRGRVHPFADVLADPGVRARLLPEARQKGLQVNRRQPAALVVQHAIAQPALQLHIGR